MGLNRKRTATRAHCLARQVQVVGRLAAALSLATLVWAPAVWAHSATRQGSDSTAACVSITAGVLNTGARLGLERVALQLQVPRGHALSPRAALEARGWRPLPAERPKPAPRPLDWSYYQLCVDNPLPVTSSLVLRLDGHSIEQLRVWRRTEGDTAFSRCVVGELPVGLGQTAVRIEAGPKARTQIVVRLRGDVQLSLTALRQHYLDTELQRGVEHDMLLAYVSASVTLLVVVLAISLVIFSRTYFYLGGYSVAFSTWGLFYSGYLTQDFAELALLNNHLLTALLAHASFALVVLMTRLLLQPAGVTAAEARGYRWALWVNVALAGLGALDELLAQTIGAGLIGDALYEWRDVLTLVGFGWMATTTVMGATAAWRRGYQPAKWLAIGYGLVLVLSLSPVLYVAGLAFSRRVTTGFILGASLVQFVAFCMAIGARFRTSQQQKLAQLAENERMLTAQKEELETKVYERTGEIEAMADQLRAQNQTLHQRNHEMVASLEYAERIQRALLPTEENLTRAFAEHFVLYQPRDIVSGDFFWSYEVGDDVFLAVADCTGHGVPGAFLSMISADLLRRIIVERQVHNPAEVMLMLDIGVRNALRQDQSDVLDGLDIGLCCFSRSSREVSFAGANHALYVATGSGPVRELRGTRRTIGEKRRKGQVTRPFQTVTLDYADFSTLYLLTDGYSDQFGEAVPRKLGRRRMVQLLTEVQHLPLAQQRTRLLDAHLAWRGQRRQVDDLLIVGIRAL